MTDTTLRYKLGDFLPLADVVEIDTEDLRKLLEEKPRYDGHLRLKVTEVRLIAHAHQPELNYVNVRAQEDLPDGETVHSMIFRVGTGEAKLYPIGTVVIVDLRRQP